MRRLSFPSKLLSNPYFLTFILSWGAAMPILGDRFPHGDDFGSHRLRLVQIAHLFEQGVWYSRWHPDLAHGYGYPLLNFMAPLSYYIALPFKLLGFTVTTSLQLTLALGIVMSGWTMYLFARDHVRPQAAIVASVAYMYAPYYAYDVLFRGNFGEAMALFWMPLALWGIGRIHQSRHPIYPIITAFSYAAVILTHNVSGLIFSPLLATYALLLAQQHDGYFSRTNIIRCASIGFGLLLSCFFWLPALSERDAIQLERLSNDAQYQVANNWQPLSEILAVPALPYADLINASPFPSLGSLPVLLGLIALLSWRQINSNQRGLIKLCLAGLALTIFLMLPISAWVWETLPLLDSLQFPYRLLAVAALFPAILIGFSAETVTPRSPHIVPIFALLLIIFAQGWLYPPYGNKGVTTIASIVRWEDATQTIGATALGEYLPKTVDEMPSEPPTARFSLLQGTVEILDETPLSAEINLSMDSAETVTFNQFNFSGWALKLNGVPTPIEASTPHGLITFPVPSGQTHVEISFQPTPLRRTASTISLVALVLIGVYLVVGLKETIQVHRPSGAPSLKPIPYLMIGLLTLALPAMRPNALTSEGALRSVEHSRALQFADGMQLLGYDGGVQTSAEKIDLTLYWTATTPPGRNYQATVNLQDANGTLWSGKQSFAPPRFRRAYGTSAWPPSMYATDKHQITPIRGTPPGQYDLIVTVFDSQTIQPIPLADTTQTQVKIGTVNIREHVALAAIPEADAIAPIQIGSNKLIGFNADRQTARPGDQLLVTLFWEAGESQGRELATLNLADSFEIEIELDTQNLEAGNRWRTQHLIRLPAATPAGELAWKIGRNTPIGTIQIEAPDRQFNPPPNTTQLNLPLGELATLVGFTHQPPEPLTLIWRADSPMSTSYRVFVHALDADGQLIAQSDGEPVQWTRPTTGWLPTEYIADTHMLSTDTPIASYRIGFYTPETGARPADPIEFTP